MRDASSGSVLASTEDIIADMRNGRMVVLVDAEDRENEGDLVIAAQMATPDAVNFMAKHGRGLVCLTLNAARADELQLADMVPHNRSRNRTAFTVSIEAREGISTGISAHDRALTIATAIDPTKGANDIVSPGHVFPLVAREGGVLVRAGHTEASVDLARLSGLYPAAVICEIMNDDGTMARLPDLVAFARTHGLKIGTIEDLIAYRLRHDRIVRRVAVEDVASAHGGDFKLHVYETVVQPVEHFALVKGDLTAPGPVLVRVHAVDPLADLAGVSARSGPAATRPGALGTIALAMEAVARAGRGVVVVIRDGRPKAVSDWLARQAAAAAPADPATGRRQLEIGVGSQILRDLGVGDMVVLTNSPAHVYVGLEAFGLRIVGTEGIGG
ncbi:MAG: 3,4-dihydroxy-2-butanone-4-phosphate synthase [Hyphomicrobiaceae bacterium]|nr:3,4-dihydroxy-2-butanone-4-phosphate synthase [Hyphomicrobiaceae bacterium]